MSYSLASAFFCYFKLLLHLTVDVNIPPALSCLRNTQLSALCHQHECRCWIWNPNSRTLTTFVSSIPLARLHGWNYWGASCSAPT